MDLNQVLESVPLAELLQTIQKKAKAGSKDVCAYIRGIFQGSQDGSDESEKRRFETYKSSLVILQMSDLSHILSSEIVSLLLLNVDAFHTSSLMKLAEHFVEYTQDSNNFCNKWVEIFTKVLSCMSHRDTIVYQGADMSGADLKKNILASLFSDDLNTSCVVQIISVIKDIDLSEGEMKLITESLLRSLPSVELIELPSFIYQLLLLSSKGQRQQILQGIISYFIKEDQRFYGRSDEDSENLIDNESEVLYRQTEGTVILMMSVSSRHDQGIRKEFSNLLKKVQHKTELVLSPFPFATALSLSKIHSNKDDIFDSLKKSLMAAYQLKNKKKNSLWMREMVMGSPDILELVKEAIRSSQFGWDHVCQGLVRFGFSAIDAFGPRYVAGNAVKSLSEDGYQLGSHILRDTFKKHCVVRNEVLEQILNQIVTKSQKPVKHYIDVLSQIVRSDPLFLLDALPKIVEILDYIHFLPHKNAVDILQSLAPLMRISMPLKDTLMLVLRKALFHRDIEARKVAVSGYLMILKRLNFIGKVSLSQSQTSISSQASSASVISTQVRADVYVGASNPSSKTMCLEIMGLLKRVLMQQGAVRQLLYEGLYDVVLQNKSLQDIVLELLLGQFEKYYNSSEDSDVPLNFNMCFQEQKGSVVLEEPLAHLISSVHLILHEAGDILDEDEYDLSAQKMLEEFLQKLTKRLCEIDVVDLHISTKDTDDSSASNTSNSTLVLNVYESILEYSLMQIKDFNSEACEELLKLYRKYLEIYESVNGKKQKKTKSKSNTTSPLMHVTLRFFSTIMHGLFADASFRCQEGLNILRSDGAFVTHIVKSCNQKLTKLSESGINDGYSEVMANSFDFVLKIAKVYFNTYNDGLSFDFSSLEWEKLSVYFADGLASVFNYINNFHPKNANKFVTGMCSDTSASTSQALQIVLKSVQKSIVKLLADTDNDFNLKETIPLLSVIKTLYNLFTTDFSDVVYKWLKQLCTRQVFQNASISKSFISLCLTLGNQHANIVTFLLEIAFDLHYHLDDIDPDEKVKGNPKYNILTPDVARNVIPNVISNLELLLDEVEYVLNFMKANAVIPAEFLSLSSSHVANIQNMEQGVSTRLSDMILVFHELVQSAVPPDHTGSSIFKLIARFYRILCTLTRYYLLRHIKSKTVELHVTFEKLVKLSHTKLTTYVYSFITYLQVMCEQKDRKKVKSNIAISKAMREIKTVPALVFAIESYEKNLILLSKKYNRNLMNHMKLSIARDFRINAAVLAAAQQASQATDSTMDDASVNTADNATDNDEIADNMSDHDDNVRDEAVDNASDHEDSDASNQEVVNSSSDNDSTISNITTNNRPKNNASTTRNKLCRGNSSKNKSMGNATNKSMHKSKPANKSTHKSNTNSMRIESSKRSKPLNEENVEDINVMDVDVPDETAGHVLSKGKKLSMKRKRLGVRGNTKKAK